MCGCGTCVSCVSSGLGPGGVVRPRFTKLAERLQPTVDRMRGRYENYGLRPNLVYMVWTKWTGDERGEGREYEVAKVKIVPTPKVDDLTKLSLSPFTGGTLPTGSIGLSQVTAVLTADNLKGLAVPGQAYVDACRAFYTGMPGGTPIGQMALDPVARARGEGEGLGRIPQPYDFFYEVVEDRPGSPPAKFRLFSEPFRDAEKFEWRFILERVSEDRGRDGHSRLERG